MQPHPGPKAAQIARQIGDVGAVPPVGRVLQVQPIGAGVLADDQQLPHPGLHQALGLAHHGMGRRLTRRPRMSGMMQNLHL